MIATIAVESARIMLIDRTSPTASRTGSDWLTPAIAITLSRLITRSASAMRAIALLMLVGASWTCPAGCASSWISLQAMYARRTAPANRNPGTRSNVETTKVRSSRITIARPLPQSHRLPPLRCGQPVRGQSNDHRVVTRNHGIDEHDLNDRRNPIESHGELLVFLRTCLNEEFRTRNQIDQGAIHDCEPFTTDRIANVSNDAVASARPDRSAATCDGVFSVQPVLPASGPESRRRAGSPRVPRR